ncbi:ubinuclein-1-like isoform X2 [Leptopilina heterotoma]|uniref:ubinuclein-1-like isoform X2 n=1 Tax=Leptopilina heterotoma TaxID=63436 RepID=UPI001CA92411|nr:ubinuclein-1-like isoform X2 [Leptopilina heterotoma]
MSEPKRVPLQTLEFPDSLGHAAKKDKDKKLLPSHRFTLTLPEPNEERCPEFSYTKLLKNAEKKRIKENKRKNNHTTNGLDPYDDDDEDNLKEMAKKFEAKYGYTDLGAGYDENDSFIDNTDAYDEIVPDEVTTAYGGFYINSGALEFKNANNNTVFNVRNYNDDDDESSEDDEDEEDTPKRSDKRTNSSSECEEGEEIVREHPAKKQKLEEVVEKKSNNDNVVRKKKKLNHQSEEIQNNSSQNTRESESVKKNTEQSKVDKSEKETNESEEKKKNTKLNDVQRTKTTTTTGEKKFDVKKFVKKVSSNGFDSKKEVKEVKEVKKDTNIDNAIESVVNASHVDVDESSRETSDSGKSRGAPGTESDCEELDKQECPLPDCLPDDVKEICNNLKILAKQATGKSKFFSPNVSTLLFSLEGKLRVIGTNSVRQLTYKHLAHHLPCTKTTLINRAKKMHMQYQRGRVKSQLEKLKSIIDQVMPAAEVKYKRECQRIMEDKNLQSPIRDSLSDQNDADGGVNKNSDKMPQKKFPWNDDSINIVREMASSRKSYFKISRTRKESLDTFIATFFETDVLPLWPEGWMKLENLLQCATGTVSPKKKQKKSKDTSVSSNCIVIASGSVNNTQKSETIANNTSSHHAFDKGKTISNSYKVNSTENSLNLTITKSNDSYNEKKQISSKHKEKNNSSLTINKQTENATPPNVPIGKITVVPTAQLLAKPSNNIEKFNPMDLTSNSSLSITPVDYQKPITIKTNDIKKDTVSIIPFSETTTITATHNETAAATTNISQQSHYHSRQDLNNQNSVMVSMPIRVLQDAAIETIHNRKTDVDHDLDYLNKSEKKQERYYDGRHQKTHETKKRKRESKSDKEKIEQEQKQIEETVAATNYLSQIINDDLPEKKEAISIDDLLGSTPASDQEKDDVQMVMRSIQQLQEVLNNSPTNSSVGSSASKSIKNDIQYNLYSKNDNNYRISKEDNQW